MKRRHTLALLQVTALLWAGQAAAEERPAPEEAATERPAVEPTESGDFGHGGQFSLRAGLAAGYRVVFRYDTSPYCRDPREEGDGDPQQLCGFGAPAALDVALGFAPLDVLEPYLWGRFGLAAEGETDTEALKVVGAGVRLYSRSEAALKIFIEPAVGIELEGGRGTPRYQANEPTYGTDLLFHIAAGPQYDVTREVGLYLGAGLTTGVRRAIHTNMEAQFGAQGRF